MILFGDNHFMASWPAVIRQLAARVPNDSAPTVASLRTLLIQAGQLEQAFFDLPAENTRPCARPEVIARLTDLAAEAFCRRLRNEVDLVCTALLRLRSELQSLHTCPAPSASLEVKIPEGFEFYALYPEQYILAARQWWRSQHGEVLPQVLVAGIRSIGTTLSAIVAAELKIHGGQVRRFTVRPEGPPFARTVRLPPLNLQSTEHALVVDEGPGLSGSSFVAVARALVSAGLTPRSLSFFPGHNQEPGNAATAEVRSWWSRIRRYVAPLASVRWEGASLEQSLVERTASLLPVCDDVQAIECVGGGAWRRLVFRHDEEWPPVAGTFERLKYRCTTRRDAVVWKFTGLGAFRSDGRTQRECVLERAMKRAAQGISPPILACHGGFVAWEWVAAPPLAHGEITGAKALGQCGSYIARVVDEAWTPEDFEDGIQRLATMLEHNAREQLGSAAAQRARQLRESMRMPRSLPSYGDGRMSRHHWRRAGKHRLLKISGLAPVFDHTIIGQQSVLWDVAAAAVEWSLTPSQQSELISKVCGRRTMNRAALQFHRAAYLAFRMAQMAPSAAVSCDEAREVARRRRALENYRARLEACLRDDPD